MNGETQELLRELEKNFIELDTKNTERWRVHRERADEIKTIIVNIHEKLNELQCDVHVERMKNITGNLSRIWVVVIMMISSMVGGFWFLIKK